MNPTTALEAPQPDALFGAAVRSRRAQLGITLDQLAQASGVSPGALSRVERGLLATSLRNAMAIARGLGCELGELVQSAAAARVTRAGEHLRYADEASGVERLALASPSAGVHLLEYRFPPRAESSHFAAHRDNSQDITAHRRFAVSINLTDAFEGGAVSFPEYNLRGYKAPPGWAVVFPANILHAVGRVTGGRRYAFLPFVYDDAGAQIRQRNLAAMASQAAPQAATA